MFGERYFATRKKLADLVDEVRTLADSSGVELNGFEDGSTLLQGLHNPFLFVVSGEVNAGKSTFLNGLLGADLCEVNVLPKTDRVCWYRYGAKAVDEEVTAVLEERRRPIEFLRDFNVVDTPGTNSVVKEHQAVTERFLHVADLILFVFPVSNPWGAATWDFITRLPAELYDNIVLILQQKDLRQEDELEIIVTHMRDLARQKLGLEPNIFPVSGKLALKAKGRAPFQDRLLRESGFAALEDFIADIVTESPGRREVLQRVQEATGEALRLIEERLEERHREVDGHATLLSDLEHQVDLQRDSYGSVFATKLEKLGEVFSNVGVQSLQLLRERVAVWPSLRSLFNADDSPAIMERILSERAEQAVGDLSRQESEELALLCQQHWEAVAPRIEAELGIDPPGVEDGSVDVVAAKQKFIGGMERAAREGVVRLKLRGLLEMELDVRRNVLQRFVAGALLLVSIGGGLGAAGLHPWSWVAIGLAVLVGAIGIGQARRSGEKLVRWFGDRLIRSRDNFTAMLSEEYREGVRAFFSRYASLFEVVRRHVAQCHDDLKPRERDWNNLFLELKAMEQELE